MCLLKSLSQEWALDLEYTRVEHQSVTGALYKNTFTLFHTQWSFIIASPVAVMFMVKKAHGEHVQKIACLQ